MHRNEYIAGSQQEHRELFRDVLARAARAGAIRNDVPPDELARYTIHALSAASSVPGKAAVDRLVTMTRAGLRRPRR